MEGWFSLVGSVMRAESGGLGVASVERKELHAAALHAGGWAVGAARVHVAADVAVVSGVGVDDDADRTALLREIDLDAAEVAAVAGDDDLALYTDAEPGKLIEVGERAVVGVDGVGGDVAGGGRTVEGGEDAGVILIGIAAVGCGIDVFRAGAGHELLAVGVEGFDFDLERLVEPDTEGNDVGVEAGGLELLGDVEGGFIVFRRAGPVGLGGEDFEVLAGQGGVGNGHEGVVPLLLLGEVGVAEDARRGRLGEGGGGGEQDGQKHDGAKAHRENSPEAMKVLTGRCI
jgi:hypothetical protein